MKWSLIPSGTYPFAGYCSLTLVIFEENHWNFRVAEWRIQLKNIFRTIQKLFFRASFISSNRNWIGTDLLFQNCDVLCIQAYENSNFCVTPSNFIQGREYIRNNAAQSLESVFLNFIGQSWNMHWSIRILVTLENPNWLSHPLHLFNIVIDAHARLDLGLQD